MPRPSTPAKFMFVAWIAAVVLVATVAIVAAGAVKSSRHGGVNAVAVAATAKPAMAPRPANPAANARIRANYAALPLAFEANQGQADPEVKFVARGDGYKLLLTSSKAIMALPGHKGPSEVRDMMMNKRRGAAGVKALMKKRAASHLKASPAAFLQMNFLGANPHSQLAADDPRSGKVNYFLGNDPSKWHSNIPLYGRVNYRNIYPGVDLVFHGASQRLEFDYRVSPGSDAAAIALGFQGADGLRTDAAGNLVLSTSAGPVHLNKPVAYQAKNGVRELVDASFVLKGKNQVSFALGSYDHNRELVIDPTVTYSTYFGGNSADYGIAVAVDAGGDSFVAGATDSASIPGWSLPLNGGFDVFVTEIDPTGALVFTTIFGGAQDDFPGGIVIDSSGIYVAGTTDSADFPAAGGAQSVFSGGITGGSNDAFAIKLDANGSRIWGTYVGGNGSDSGLGVAVDSAQNVYVVGETFSTNLANGALNFLPGGDALNLGLNPTNDDGYIVEISSTGASFAMVSYLGGSGGDLATGIAINSSDTIFVTGETISIDLPTTPNPGVLQPQCGTDANCNATASTSFDDGFVVSIPASLAGYNYFTYYGGSNVDDALAIAADASGNAYITGTTASTDFPTAGSPFQNSLFGTENAFLVQLNSTGTGATYSSYFGGDGSDLGLSVALDSSVPPNAYITGQSSSSSASFPLVNPTQDTGSGSTDAFVGVFGLSQGQILFSTFLGGGADEDQFEAGIGVDSLDNIYVTGDTDSGNGTTEAFPTTAAISTTYGGGTCVDSIGNNVPCTDAFVAAYGAATAPDFTITASALSPTSVAPGGSATSTITIVPLNGYAGTVGVSCSVSGTGAPLPACSLDSTATTLTVTTTGAAVAIYRPSGIFYAMWLPVVGLSLVGMRFSTGNSRKKKFLGFLLLGVIMSALFFLPACGGSSGGGGGGGGCSGCTPAGTYTVNVTGTDSVNANLSHSVSPALTLTVN